MIEIHESYNIIGFRKSIEICRKQCKLPQIEMGERDCLKCGRDFVSDDVKNNRLCETCKRSNANFFSQYDE